MVLALDMVLFKQRHNILAERYKKVSWNCAKSHDFSSDKNPNLSGKNLKIGALTTHDTFPGIFPDPLTFLKQEE